MSKGGLSLVVHFEKQGGHVRTRWFIGKRGYTRALAGVLTFSDGIEWEAISHFLTSAPLHWCLGKVELQEEGK